jgi:hypothetical protein
MVGRTSSTSTSSPACSGPSARGVELDERHGPGCVFGIDGGGPAADLIQDFEDAGLTVLTLGTKDIARACADLTKAVNDPLGDDGEAVAPVAHGPQPELQLAVEVARKRAVGGDGSFAFRRDVDALPLLAAAEAKWVLEHGIGEVSMFSSASLDLCDQCGKQPHEDPDGEHDYLCAGCRPTGDEGDSSIPPNSAQAASAPVRLRTRRGAALGISTVLACVKALYDDQTVLPFWAYTGERQRRAQAAAGAAADRHRAVRPRPRPGAGFGQLVVSTAMRGNAYAASSVATRTPLPDQLLVLHPDSVTAEARQEARQGLQDRGRRPPARRRDRPHHRA